MSFRLNLARTTRWVPHHGMAPAPTPTLGAVPAPAVQPGTFPFPEDLRDPNTAWSGGDKAIFLALFVLTYALLCVIVAWRKPLKRALDSILSSQHYVTVFRHANTGRRTAEVLLD